MAFGIGVHALKPEAGWPWLCAAVRLCLSVCVSVNLCVGRGGSGRCVAVCAVRAEVGPCVPAVPAVCVGAIAGQLPGSRVAVGLYGCMCLGSCV
jgi:hypothetical protein